MCGRFVCDISPEKLSEVFGVSVSMNIPRSFNIAPSNRILAVRCLEKGNELALLRWGLVPSWAKDSAQPRAMINARSETAHDKPAFRQAIRQRRCIVPASGFYEWSGEGRKRQPFYLRLKDGALMGLAGIWEQWQNPVGEILQSCAILTTAANSLIRTIHDRMPVIIPSKKYDFWLDRSVTAPEKLQFLYTPYPAELLEMYPVSTLVNSPFNDSASCNAPLI